MLSNCNAEKCNARTEFDCDDGTCIDLSLKCNGAFNCKYRYDEDAATTCLVGQFSLFLLILSDSLSFDTFWFSLFWYFLILSWYFLILSLSCHFSLFLLILSDSFPLNLNLSLVTRLFEWMCNSCNTLFPSFPTSLSLSHHFSSLSLFIPFFSHLVTTRWVVFSSFFLSHIAKYQHSPSLFLSSLLISHSLLLSHSLLSHSFSYWFP